MTLTRNKCLWHATVCLCDMTQVCDDHESVTDMNWIHVHMAIGNLSLNRISWHIMTWWYKCHDITLVPSDGLNINHFGYIYQDGNYDTTAGLWSPPSKNNCGLIGGNLVQFGNRLCEKSGYNIVCQIFYTAILPHITYCITFSANQCHKMRQAVHTIQNSVQTRNKYPTVTTKIYRKIATSALNRGDS